MKFRFEPNGRLVLIDAILYGPLGELDIRLALDTGATRTQLIPEVMSQIGYPVTEGNRIRVGTAGGMVERQKTNIQGLSALGLSKQSLSIVVGELPTKSRLHGLLGLDFLRDRIITLNFRNGTISVRKSTFWLWS